MQKVTLQELKEACRARADMQNSGFISDLELTSYINSSAQELYDLLVTKFEDYYLLVSDFTLVPPASSVTLPSDFYKLKGVDISRGGGLFETARPFTFQDRNKGSNPILYPMFQDVAQLKYRLQGSNTLAFIGQAGTGTVTGRVWYIPVMEKLVNDADELDGINGWEEYIIVDVVIKMLQKEESDTRTFMLQKQQLKQRIEETAANRDVGSPEAVSDVTYYPWGPFRRF